MSEVNDTPELSNVARVLISRMESHPQDFDIGERFGHLQESLYTLLGLQTTNPYGGQGRLSYLNDTDRAALADAWRALNYKKFEKEVMDALFQSDAEREEERKKFAYPQVLTTQQQRVALQNQMLAQSTGTIGPISNTGTSIHPLQNNVTNTGGFLSEIFGGSR